MEPHHRHTQFHHLEASMSNASFDSQVDHKTDDQFERLETSSNHHQVISTSNMNTDNNSSHCDIWRMTSSPAEIATKLALMTQAPRICLEMRNDGVLPLLVQFLHHHSTEDGMLAISGDTGSTAETDRNLDSEHYHQPTSETFRSTFALRRNSAKALRNIVTNTAKNKKEVEILGLLEDLRSFVEIFYLKWSDMPVEAVDHPCSQMAEIFAFACDSNYKKTIELYGGVYVISDVIQSDFRFHRAGNTNEQCFLLRQYSLNVLTYMTAQNDTVKSVLGSMRPFIGMLVETLQQAPQMDNLQLLQSVANVLHNLSWKSDFNSKQIMRDFKTVYHLAKLAMETTDLKTLKALLEPLLNLTAHCTPNKVDFCKVDGVLDFLISKLKSNTLPTTSTSSTLQLSPTKLAIVENSGGILRNISSYLVTQEDLIEQLRAQNIVAILLEQLKAASLAIVSNACITLSYLAASSSKDALKIKELGGIQILHGLTNSKHEPIKLGASKTLQHLFTSHLTNYSASFKETPTMSTSYSIPSSLQMRKLKAFKTEIHCFLSENFDTLQGEASLNGSPNHLQNRNLNAKTFNMNTMNHSNYQNVSSKVTRSSSHDSIGSTHSEPVIKLSIHHRRSLHQSIGAPASADHKSAAAAALQNLSTKSGSSPADQRMIHSYSGQTLNCLYATLPANSRIGERENYSMMMESSCVNDAASDFDISICDISGSSLSCPMPPAHKTLGNSTSNTANSSSTPDYLDEEEEEDPAPTDYSQRFKEQVIDDFSPPQSASKNDTSTGEDTVKVYQTENTPLVFSLAPSFSDLREVASSNANYNKMNNLSNLFNALELKKSVQKEKLFEKPLLAPRPSIKLPSSSASAYNSKIPYSIDENEPMGDDFTNEQQNLRAKPGIAKSMSSHESLKYYAQNSGPRKGSETMSGERVKQYTRSSSMGEILYSNDNYGHPPINTENTTNNNKWTSKSPNSRWANKLISNSGITIPLRTIITNRVNRQTDSLEQYTTNDSAQIFATEDTPAIFSHATSLSSLSMDDDLDDFSGGHQQLQKQTTPKESASQTHDKNASLMSSPNLTNIQQSSNNSKIAVTATYQKNSMPLPVQSNSKSPLSKMLSSAPTASLVKTTPVAAKRMSKTPTNSTNPANIAQFCSEKLHLHSTPPPPRPPKKPLPSIPMNESQVPKVNTQLLNTQTNTTVLQNNDDDDDDYDDFMFKCRQLVMPKETQIKPKITSKTGGTAKSSSSVNRSKPSHNNDKQKNQLPLRSQSSLPVQLATSNQTNSSQSSNTRNIPKTNTKIKNTSNSNIKDSKIINSTQLKQQSNNTETSNKTAVVELNNSDEDDDLLLTKCMQVAINKQSQSHSKSSSKKTSVRQSNFSNREGKSPYKYKKNPASTTISGKHVQHQIGREINLPPNEPSPIEQEKHFYVEDTPVQFSQCHSPLSLLSVDSGDEIEDQKLIEAAIQFDACRSKTIQKHTTAVQQEMSETESESATTTLTNNAKIATPLSSSSTHVCRSSRSAQTKMPLEQQIPPGTIGTNDNARNQQRPNVINKNGNCRSSNASIEQQSNSKGSGTISPNTGDSEHFLLDDGDDDERTYTICTQSSRLSSSTLTAASINQPEQHSRKEINLPSVLVMSSYSSSGSVHNIEGENPPSLVDDHNLMFSSTETNMTRSGLKFIPVQRATSARTKRTTSGPHELQTLYGGQQSHSLEEHSANSILEDQKPPSIMEHSSFMSQSTASITSEISDIALDQVPIRSASTDLVAEMASNYAKEISNLADQLCFTGTVLVSMNENVSLSPLSSPTNSSKRMVAAKTNKNDLPIKQRSDRTFDMEPSPTPGTMHQSSSAQTNIDTKTITMGRTSSNTRTYNKTDKTKNTNTTDKTLKSGDEKVDATLDDSDTDISENLPLDDVQTRDMVFGSLTKRSTSQPAMPLFNNPMDFSMSDKKPPLAPRYKPRTTHHDPFNFELTNDSSDDDRDNLHLRKSQSLNNRRVQRSSRKNSKNTNPDNEKQEFNSYRFGSFNSAVHCSEMEQTNPYSNHHQMAFSFLGRQGNSSSKIKKEKDFEDKDLLFTTKHKNTVVANHAQFFQSKSNTTQNVKSASKYFDRHAAALSSMAHENQCQMENQLENVFESAIPVPTSKRSSSIDISKPKENSKSSNKGKEKGSSIFSKISSSFSSHNIGSHTGNSGQSTPTTPSSSTSISTKTSFNKINSKFSSFFKRSKSSHGKLDQEALTINPSKNIKASKINKNTFSQRLSNKSDLIDLKQNQTNLPRSSTYEKLPVNEEEAARMSSRQLKNINNNSNTDCCRAFQPESCTKKHQTAKTLYSHCNENDQASNSSHSQLHHQFTFTTFVKTPPSNIGSSLESVSTNHGQQKQQLHQQQKTGASNVKAVTVPSDQTAAAIDSNVENTSGISVSSSSNQQSRKTCLVTTV